MAAQEILVGFDIREMWLPMSGWPQQRQNEYLIKRNIEKPLSVDKTVWQSVFDIHPIPTLPDFHGRVHSLWEDIVQMQQYFTYISKVSQPSWTIAVTLRLDLLTIDEKNAWGTLDFVSFNLTNYSTKFIGYDVADRFLLSGLMNCGYNESDRATLEQNWGEHLNIYHLFTDYDLANEFKQLTNHEVEEHAPFFVYGLYLINFTTSGSQSL